MVGPFHSWSQQILTRRKLAPLVLLATGKLPVAALQVFGRPHFLNQLSIGVTTDGLAHFPSKTYNVSIFLIGP